MEEISSNQIILRRTTDNDLDSVLKMEQSPENKLFVRQWTKEQHRDIINDKDSAHFIVQTKSNNLAGYVILRGINSPDKCIEFKRIVIDDKGKGFGRATIQLIKKTVFEKYCAHRLWLDVIDYNKRAYSLYNSEGFIDEGILRECLKQGNKFVSLRVMSILEDEYKNTGKKNTSLK